MFEIINNLKEALGVILFDSGRYWRALSGSNREWVILCNRNERVIPTEEPCAVYCDWQWSSELHAPKVFPRFGLRLMRKALKDFPVVLANNRVGVNTKRKPELTFIIGHRGRERIPHCLATLRSIAAQKDINIECIVVEQSVNPEIKDELPAWVRYVHTPIDDPAVAYNRSWAFNVGADLAGSELLVLHDNDMLVPARYANELLRRFDEGYEVINIKRFIFYLSAEHTQRILTTKELDLDQAPQIVVQNLEAGGSLAVGRETYFALGGFDEEFVGWGGEDIEFWDRAQTRHVCNKVYMPLIHLWHNDQPGKTREKNTPAMRRWHELSDIDVHRRIKNLVNRKYIVEQ